MRYLLHLDWKKTLFTRKPLSLSHQFPTNVHQYDFQRTLARHLVSLKPQAASPTVLPLTCAASLITTFS
jgi:hypothetical protein